MPTIGVDLGGTKIAAVICDRSGKVLKRKSRPTKARERGPDATIQEIAKIILELSRQKYRIDGVGLASAGPTDVLKGKLLNPVNFPGWGEVDLVKGVQSALRGKRTIHFQNDAIAASLGEGWSGGARGLQTYLAVTVGTGIGTGLVINGSPCQTEGIGSEWGHMRFRSTTVEKVAAGPSLIKRAKKMGFRGETTYDLVDHLKRSPNSKYRKVFADASQALAYLCYNLSIGTGLQKIVFSGGLSREKELFLAETRQAYQALIRPQMGVFEAPISVSKLGIWAPAIGAARLPILGARHHLV